MSDEFLRQKAVERGRLESQSAHRQRDIFHTVMGAFSMRSAAYTGKYDIFSDTFSNER
jgi:lipid A ethanolaminephosphotransferase